jgi:hypothetical protein
VVSGQWSVVSAGAAKRLQLCSSSSAKSVQALEGGACFYQERRRAIRAEQFNGYEGLKLAELPKPAVSDGKILVRMTAAGVTPLDHTILSGHFPLAKAPLVLGDEGAGVVEEGGGTDFPSVHV